METYRIDMNTCLPTSKSDVYDFHAQSHEFFLWHDPVNPNRVLAYTTIWTSGRLALSILRAATRRLPSVTPPQFRPR